MRVSLVGPMPPPSGGCTVLFSRLCRGVVGRRDVRVRVIDTTTARARGVIGGAALIRQIATEAREVDVVTVHATTSAMHILGPLAVAACRTKGTALVLRKFGGTSLNEFGRLRAALSLAAARRADAWLVETQALSRTARLRGLQNAHWFPNARDMSGQSFKNWRAPTGRFVFIGQVRAEKGVPELMRAAVRLRRSGISIDVFGALGFGITKEDLQQIDNLHYRGVLPSQQVVREVSQYDALLLPTHHRGEGYPGVILEAFAAGTPVVCTNWRSLPEVVDSDVGILIPPYDPEALASAMLRLACDADLQMILRGNVRTRREAFDERRWHQWFVELCQVLSRGHGKPDGLPPDVQNSGSPA